MSHVATLATEPLFLRKLSGERNEMDALQAVLEQAPRYFETVCGTPPGPSEAHSLYIALPPGRSYDDKIVWGLYRGGQMIGCADVIRGWNAPHKAMIGLLLLAEPFQGRGLGTAFARLVEQAITSWPEITTARIGVAQNHAAALAFWRRLGYAATGEVKPAAPPFVADIEVFEKSLPR
ncbi:MAG TPA: GNAT family N-acetyltransferase [Casimicrobiaceae bacterium]|nr:GNAT family N-acetyltransferase [Casimicrobiaceae bacterium]